MNTPRGHSGSAGNSPRTRSDRVRISRPPPDLGPKVVSRLQIRLSPDSWLRGFSREHPELVIHIHDSMPLDDQRILVEVEIEGGTSDWSEEIGNSPDVSEVDRIELPHRTPRYRVLSGRARCFRPFYELAVLPSYPRTVRHGVYFCETVSSASQLRALITAFQRAGTRPWLTSIRPADAQPVRPRPRVTLTPVQQRFFTEAFTRGYYEVPRRITLSDLADRLGRSKSSVSHALALVERKLARWAAESIS